MRTGFLSEIQPVPTVVVYLTRHVMQTGEPNKAGIAPLQWPPRHVQGSLIVLLLILHHFLRLLLHFPENPIRVPFQALSIFSYIFPILPPSFAVQMLCLRQTKETNYARRLQ